MVKRHQSKIEKEPSSHPTSDPVPSTQSFKYAGSKLKLLPHILELCQQTGINSVFDGFSGSTRVSQALTSSGYSVHANDISHWSHPLGLCFLKNPHSRQHYQELIDELNALPPKDGWFTHHYGGIQTDNKKPWQVHNTRKLDAIRDAIDEMNLDAISQAVAITSLMLAMDEVDSTLGHHASYLREWAPRSYKEMQLRVPDFNPQKNPEKHTVTRKDVFEVAPTQQCELAYFDPPYGSNNEKMPPSRVRYAAYYHLWTSICLNDKPTVFGKASRRMDSSDPVSASVFEDFRKDENGQFHVITAIDRLISSTPSQWVLLSYSSGGRATAQQLHDCLVSHGSIQKTLTLNHRQHIMGSMRNTGDWLRETEAPNQEFLFLLKKS